MPITNKIQEIQLDGIVHEIQPRSIENRNTAQTAIVDKYDWVGTTAEYVEQDVATLHPDWVCFITDDVHGEEGVLNLTDYVKKVDYEEDQTEVVHKTDDETITGTKTFVDNDSQVAIITKSKTVDNTQTPSTESQHANVIKSVDKNGVTLSAIYTVKKTDGSNGICLQAINGNDHYILGVDSIGRSTAPMPGTTSSTAAFNIATVGWVNDPTKSTNVVHKSDNEQISGYKTFTSGGHTIRIRRGTDSLNWTDIRTEDANGVRTGGFRNIEDNSGTNQTNMYIASNDGSTIIGAVSINNDGTNTWAQAPASDKLNSIVTTEGISKAANGYVKFGNGLIIQWLYNVQTPSTVTLPTPFTSTNYCCASMSTGSASHEHNISVYNKTTTTFQVANGYPGDILVIGY
jgi:hypothetical protein